MQEIYISKLSEYEALSYGSLAGEWRAMKQAGISLLIQIFVTELY